MLFAQRETFWSWCFKWKSIWSWCFKWHFLDWEKIWYHKHSLKISITKNLTTWKIANKLSNFKIPSLKSPNMYLESRLDYTLDIMLMGFLCSSYLISFTFSQDWVWNTCLTRLTFPSTISQNIDKSKIYFLSLLATHETILYHTNIVLQSLLPSQTAFPPHRNSVQAVSAKFGTDSFAKVQSCYIVQPKDNKHYKEKAPT